MPASNEIAPKAVNLISVENQAFNVAGVLAGAFNMLRFPAITERETKIASVLRPLGSDPLTREHAQVAARLLCVRWTHVHRLRRRSLASPPGHELGDTKEDGPKARHWLDRNVEVIVQTALDQWMPRQRHLTHSWLDLCKEIGQRCTGAHLPQPSRNTVAQRWALYRGEQQALLANPQGALAGSA